MVCFQCKFNHHYDVVLFLCDFISLPGKGSPLILVYCTVAIIILVNLPVIFPFTFQVCAVVWHCYSTDPELKLLNKIHSEVLSVFYQYRHVQKINCFIYLHCLNKTTPNMIITICRRVEFTTCCRLIHYVIFYNLLYIN